MSKAMRAVWSPQSSQQYTEGARAPEFVVEGYIPGLELGMCLQAGGGSVKLTDKRGRIRALVVLGLLLPVVTVHLGGRAVGVDGPIADTSISVVPVPGIEAPGHRVKYLARPNPIQVANGLALDGAGHLYIDRVLRNSIWKLNLASGTLSEIASDYEEPREQQLQSPDDMVFDSDGNLYVLEPIAHTVARIAPDGTRTRLPGQITDGVTVPNGIAFRENRLFVGRRVLAPAQYPVASALRKGLYLDRVRTVHASCGNR